MDFLDVAIGYLHSPTLYHDLVAMATWAKPHSVSLFCTDTIMISSEYLADLKATVQSEGTFADVVLGMDKDKVQETGLSIKFLGVIWSVTPDSQQYANYRHMWLLRFWWTYCT